MKRHLPIVGIALLCTAVTVIGLSPPSAAQTKLIKIGLSLPLTGADADGADADGADAILKRAQMAIAEINAKGGVGGYKFEVLVFDSATLPQVSTTQRRRPPTTRSSSATASCSQPPVQ